MLRGDFQHLDWMAHGRSMSYRADPRRLKAEQRIACNENNAIFHHAPGSLTPNPLHWCRLVPGFSIDLNIAPGTSLDVIFLWWKCIPLFFGLDKFLWHQDFQQVLRAHVFQIPGENMWWRSRWKSAGKYHGLTDPQLVLNGIFIYPLVN